MVLFSNFEIFNFFFFKKMLKLKWPFPRRKGLGRARQVGPCLSLLYRRSLNRISLTHNQKMKTNLQKFHDNSHAH